MNENYSALLASLARQAGDRSFDESVSLIAEPGKYNPIHTRMWSGIRHSHRESLLYALALLETGEVPRAEMIMMTLFAAQDTDPASDTYGIWSYYHEEPLAEMVPPDWNWADFLGRDLAFIMLRHSDRLSAAVLAAARIALGHAARSIIRRNVSMGYTNIAAKGTFVTLAAGQLLDDAEIADYAVARTGRLQDQIREAGSFAEYNSPGYWAITLEAITAIRQFIDHPVAQQRAEWIAEQLWQHFANRWHRPTGQLSGPMARAYTSDQRENPGVLAMLARATGFAAPFGDRSWLKPSLSLVVPSILDTNPAPAIVDRLLQSPVGVITERFSYTDLPDGRRFPFVGTTWRGRAATVGTANASEFWLQRRPLLGYWAEPDDVFWSQNRLVRLRVLKNDFDFSSAVFSSVQAGGHALWATGFISPGGDEHVGLNKIEAGQPFAAESLKLIFEIAGADDASIAVDGAAVEGETSFGIGQQVIIDTGSIELSITIAAVRFGAIEPRLTVRDKPGLITVPGLITIEAELLPGGEEALVLQDVGEAFICGTFGMIERPSTGSGNGSSTGWGSEGAAVEVGHDRLQASWTTPDGDRLQLSAPATVGTAAEHWAAVDSRINDQSAAS